MIPLLIVDAICTAVLLVMLFVVTHERNALREDLRREMERHEQACRERDTLRNPHPKHGA